MPKPILAGTSHGAPSLEHDQWFELVYGYNYFSPPSYWSAPQRLALEQRYAALLTDLRRYLAAHGDARRADAIAAWAEARGIRLLEPGEGLHHTGG